MTPEKELLKELFDQLPNAEMPFDFHNRLMGKIEMEAARIRRRNEQLGWIALIVASLCMAGLAVAAFVFMGLPSITFSLPELPDLSELPFYLYIGTLVLLLLGADYKFRQWFKKRHSNV